jgi:hypothetical protein
MKSAQTSQLIKDLAPLHVKQLIVHNMRHAIWPKLFY